MLEGGHVPAAAGQCSGPSGVFGQPKPRPNTTTPWIHTTAGILENRVSVLFLWQVAGCQKYDPSPGEGKASMGALKDNFGTSVLADSSL